VIALVELYNFNLFYNTTRLFVYKVPTSKPSLETFLWNCRAHGKMCQ